MGEFFLLGNSIEVRDMLQASQLSVKGSPQSWITVPKGAGGDASDRVEVATTVVVLHPTAATFVQGEWEPRVGSHDCGGMGAGGLEPQDQWPADFESAASTNSARLPQTILWTGGPVPQPL